MKKKAAPKLKQASNPSLVKLPREGTKKVPFRLPNPSEELPEKLEGFDSDEHDLDPEKVLVDPRFASELTYEGYDHIEEYDNNAFNAKTTTEVDPEEELEFTDRESDPDGAEESPIDPQEHRRP